MTLKYENCRRKAFKSKNSILKMKRQFASKNNNTSINQQKITIKKKKPRKKMNPNFKVEKAQKMEVIFEKNQNPKIIQKDLKEDDIKILSKIEEINEQSNRTESKTKDQTNQNIQENQENQISNSQEEEKSPVIEISELIKKENQTNNIIHQGQEEDSDNISVNILPPNENFHRIKTKEEMINYYKALNDKIISQNGEQIIENFLNKQKLFKIEKDFLSKHNISPSIRFDVINWLIKICYQLEIEMNSFFAAVNIFDGYLSNQKNRVFSIIDFELIGITCLYISSKIESNKPLSIKSLISSPSLSKYSDESIKNQEFEILTCLDFNLSYCNLSDFIGIIFSSLSISPEFLKRKSDDFEHYIYLYENVCMFLSEFVKYFDEFSSILISKISLGCIMVGFELLSAYSRNMKKDVFDFLNQWIKEIIEKCKENVEDIRLISSKIKNCWNNSLSKINSFSLTHFHEISLD